MLERKIAAEVANNMRYLGRSLKYFLEYELEIIK